MGYVRSETRSLGQPSLKPCMYSRGQGFASVLMKLHRMFHQNVCLDNILVKFKYKSCRNKTKVTITDFVFKQKPKQRKTLCALCFALIFMKLNQIIYLDNISVVFEYGSCWIKNEVSRSNFIKTLYAV